MVWLIVLAAVVVLGIALVATLVRRLGGPGQVADVIVRDPTDDTRIDGDGAVRSVQGADIVLSDERFSELWTPETLERLARTYWSYLTYVTLGLIRVYYTEGERYVCLLFQPFKLLTFQAPEYETAEARGIVLVQHEVVRACLARGVDPSRSRLGDERALARHLAEQILP